MREGRRWERAWHESKRRLCAWDMEGTGGGGGRKWHLLQLLRQNGCFITFRYNPFLLPQPLDKEPLQGRLVLWSPMVHLRPDTE